MLLIGRVLNNRYEIEERLGGGGMAVVYRARDAFLGRPVSIKVLREQFASDADFLERFRREAQAVASLSHPNIVSLYDVGQDGDVHYLVMEYVEGRTLKDRIAHDGPLPARTAVEVARQVLDALEHAHQQQVVHRDIKSHNILLAKSGRVKVADFGIARATNGATLVHTGSIVGSAHYFSPEQARGRAVDERSDLYSAGVVLYEMLTGNVPFQGDSPISVALKHVQEEPPSPRDVNPAVPPDLEKVIKKALAKDPARRYQTVGEFRADLDAWLAGRPVEDGGGWEDETLVAGPDRAWNVDLPDSRVSTDGVAERRRAGRHNAGRPPAGGRLKLVALAVLAALALAGYGVYLFMSWFQVPVVKVPDVRGIDQVEAGKRLEAAGLRAAVLAQPHSDQPAGIVIGQKPAPGEEVKRGREVGLTVSRGPEFVTVPDVTGQPRQTAQNLLNIDGFKIVENSGYHETVPRDYVINQNPSGNSSVKRGSTVFLTISKGPPPPPFGMPDLIGSTLEDALNTLQQLRLTPRQQARELSGFPEGRVARQSPVPGATVREGDAVDLVVSSGCAAVTQKTFPVTADAPVAVRVTVADQLGQRVVYERSHQPGDQVSLQDICWDGTLGRLTVYYGDQIVSQEVLVPGG